MIARTAALLAVALVAAGCGGNKQAGVASTAECQRLPGSGTTERNGPALAEPMYLTDVTLERLDCADRVVFQFGQGQPQAPGYYVSYVEETAAKTEDGSGKHIDIEGNAFLVVKLQPAATAKTTGDKLTLTYTGPRRIEPADALHVAEVVKTGDFENVVTWVIGLDEQRPFTAKGSDAQLVVDLG